MFYINIEWYVNRTCINTLTVILCLILQGSLVHQENYLKISKVYIFMELFKHYGIDRTLRERSNDIVASLNDILCEFSFLVDMSGYQPIAALDRNIISREYTTLSLTQFYNWDYILLRDTRTFGRSLLNAVKSSQFSRWYCV